MKTYVICLRCSEGSYLTNDGKCKELNAEMKERCKETIPGDPEKCAICKHGYYRENSV